MEKRLENHWSRISLYLKIFSILKSILGQRDFVSPQSFQNT